VQRAAHRATTLAQPAPATPVATQSDDTRVVVLDMRQPWLVAITVLGCACGTSGPSPGGGSADGGKADGDTSDTAGADGLVALLGPRGTCLDAKDGATDDGTVVQLWHCNGTAAQQWTLAPDGSVHHGSGKCLDATGGATGDGTPIQLWDCNGTDAQRWTYTADRALVGTAGNCLDATGGNTADGTPIQLWHCNQTAAQNWTVRAKLRTDVFLIEQYNVCIAGDPCPATPPASGCLPIFDGSGTIATSYAIDEHLSVSPYQPGAAPPGSTCLQLTLGPDEETTLRMEVHQFATNVETWSHGALALDVRVHVVPAVSSSLSVFEHSLWASPSDLDAALRPSLGSATSFVMVSGGLRDPSGLHPGLDYCGLSFGADFGLAGAGYSWVPRTGNVGSFECGQHGVLEIEWMHQLYFAVHSLSRFADLYPTSFPACGKGDPDPLRWFPDPDPNITNDPDSPFCGKDGETVDNDPAIQHVLETHWPAMRNFVANHCSDGVQDYGETGVDAGGTCHSAS
jgi:ricin-type beta-trefoil lectin protein